MSHNALQIWALQPEPSKTYNLLKAECTDPKTGQNTAAKILRRYLILGTTGETQGKWLCDGRDLPAMEQALKDERRRLQLESSLWHRIWTAPARFLKMISEAI